MVSPLARVGIRTRILFLLALPLALLGAVGGYLYERERAMAAQAERIAEIVSLGPSLGALVHELQKERGMSAGFVGSDGARFGDRLPDQRAATDTALAGLRRAVDERAADGAELPYLRKLKADLARFDLLPTLRREVDGLLVEVPELARRYTKLVRRLLDTTRAMTGVAEDPRLLRAILAHVHLLEAKELSGLERALGAVGFGRGGFSPVLYNGFLEKAVLQAEHLREARFWAQPGMRRLIDELSESPAFREVERLRETVTRGVGTGDLGSTTGEQWFAAVTRKIDAMKAVEDRSVRELAVLAGTLAGHAEQQARRLGVAALVALVFLLGAGTVVWRSITVPLARLVEKTRRLADGDTSVEIGETDRRDEIGTMARALAHFREVRERADREERAKAERARRLEETMARFGERVGGVLAALAETTATLDQAATEMTETAKATHGNADAMAGSAERVSADMRTMAAAIHQLSTSVEEIARQAGHASAIAGGAVEDAGRARQVAGELAEVARRIEEVLGLISSITEQTHMLALNATIEAARAGEVGRGFAVVAGEVKNLAGATADATEKVRALVEQIGGATSQVVGAVERVHDVLSEIDGVAATIAGATEEQSAAVREMSDKAESAASDTARASEAIGGVRDAAGLNDRASERVRAAVTVVARQTEELRNCVESFLSDIRAA